MDANDCQDRDVVRRTEVIAPEPAEGLAGVLDIPAPSLATDAELPSLWHWIYLLERRNQRELGHDGHPDSGIPAPPEPNRLRMFAGGRVKTIEPLLFGRSATRTTRIVSTTQKQGRSGELTFLTVRHEIEQNGRLKIIDEQDLVYRTAGSKLATVGAATKGIQLPPVPPADRMQLEFAVDSVLLFRFSALTYNAHRIHYDLPFAASEGYPDLVVHGPLQALLMGELLRRSGISLIGAEFAYRLVAPTFGKQVLSIASDDVDPRSGLKVRDANGTVTATSRLN
jgi:3-methylfumaryl-CoA hydratase